VIVRRESEGKSREFDARSSIESLELAAGEHPAALDAQVRFTPRAQVRPDEIVRLLIPDGDARTVDVERVMLWANLSGRRLDPIQLLGTKF